MAARVAKKKVIKMNTIPIDFNMLPKLEPKKEIQQQKQEEEQILYKQSQLPEGFAEQVLKYEMDIEIGNNISIKTIHDLLELYTLAVGYYESIGDNKYKYFHKKINSLMVNPIVISAIKISQVHKKYELQESNNNNDKNNFTNNSANQGVMGEEIISNTLIARQDKNKTNKQSEEISSKQEIISNNSNQFNQIQNFNDFDGSKSTTNNVKKEEGGQVLQKLSNEQQDSEQQKIKQDNKISQIQKKTIQEGIKLNVIYEMQETSDKSKSILNSHKQDQLRTQDFISKQIDGQTDDIKKRLQSRKRTSIASKPPDMDP